jgi:glycosyltransferase involved in cell wall biosynthesis
VAEAIESALAQTRPPDEVVVVDDGSTDETPEHVRPYPVRYVRQENAGEASARNRGIAEARGDFVAFLDHDDLWVPTKLERQSETIGDADLLFSDCCERDDTGTTTVHEVHDWSPLNALERLSRSFVILTPSAVLVRRAALVPFEPVKPFGTDWLMWLRLAQAGRTIEHLPEPLTIRRVHGANMSAGYDQWIEAGSAVFRHFAQPRATAAWHLEAAIRAKRRGERGRARRHILIACRARPASVRPGWIRMLA